MQSDERSSSPEEAERIYRLMVSAGRTEGPSELNSDQFAEQYRRVIRGSVLSQGGNGSDGDRFAVLGSVSGARRVSLSVKKRTVGNDS